MSKVSCIAAEKHRRCTLRMAQAELLRTVIQCHKLEAGNSCEQMFAML